MCKPISGLTEKNQIGGVERYAHNSGEVLRATYMHVPARTHTKPTENLRATLSLNDACAALCQVNFQTRSPWQLASTLGFVLDRGESGNFMGLKPRELAALHECLAWGREPGNNPVLRFYGQTFEDFSDACRTLAAKWKHLLPTGNNRALPACTGAPDCPRAPMRTSDFHIVSGHLGAGFESQMLSRGTKSNNRPMQ